MNILKGGQNLKKPKEISLRDANIILEENEIEDIKKFY